MRIAPRRILRVPLLVVLLCALGAQRNPEHVSPAATPAEDWKEIDRLVSQQKFDEALRRVSSRREVAAKAGDEPEWTKALIREVQLRIGLHGYETAVRFLKEQPWPKGLLPRTELELFYAQSLVTYFHAYSWEIHQRERVESTGAVDLKAWTGPQIYAEALRAYLRLWKEREALGRENVQSLAEFVDVNDYPAGIRDTVRDAVTYFLAAHLSDASGWSPAESNEVFRLDLSRLLRDDRASTEATRLDSESVHPLVKVVAALADLEAWHGERREREAAFEVRLERLRRLFAAFAEEEDRGKIEKDLEDRLPGVADLPWLAMGKAQLAEFVEQPDLSGDLVRAHAVAGEGLKAYPSSIGGQRCLAIVKRIEAPGYQISAMQSDGPGRRSILVQHKNVGRLQFRAYALDLSARVEGARNQYAILPSGEELRKIVDAQTAVADWSVALPATADFRTHATYVTPPMKEAGLYVVAASGAERFGGPGFPLVATNFILSDIVLVTRPTTSNSGRPDGLEVQALSGESGRPLAGVDISAFRTLWNPERIERLGTVATDAKGLAWFPSPGERPAGGVFVFARRGPDSIIDSSVFFPYGQPATGATTASLLFTDRSIYRPLQKILWKVLAYRGDARAGRFAVLPASAVTVSLVDQNNQKVDSRTTTTNDFGSAAGEFVIPPGRALGAWRLESSLGGAPASVHVEEYKRPTFEVTLKDPAEPLRLNRPAKLTGEARYYFGLPVASGSVSWRVTRTPQWFWWSFGAWLHPGVSTQTVASGVAALRADGTFEIGFTPLADERLGKDAKDLTYSYRVDADTSDEGGETRTASRSFRLGFVSIEARVDAPPGFLLDSRVAQLRIVRTSLDGVPRPGSGSWRIVRLEQPQQTILPADQPPSAWSYWSGRPPGIRRRNGMRPAVETPGDRVRPRWDAEYAPDQLIRAWKDGAGIANGDATHDAKGEASIEIPKLPAGAYRLRYTTADEFGAVFEMPYEFVVGGKKTDLAVPAYLGVEKPSVRVGGTARFLVASGLSDQVLFFDVYSAGRRIERRELKSGQSASVIEMSVAEKDRGGFSVKLSALRDHQWMSLSQTVFVPWDDKDLKVSFATFRDKLRPGARETWRVNVEAPEGHESEHVAAELLAYIYDRSLDAFLSHYPPDPRSIYPNRTGADWSQANLGQVGFGHIRGDFPGLPGYPSLRGDSLKFYGGYAIGGPGQRGAFGYANYAAAAETVTVSAESPLVRAAPKSAPAKDELKVEGGVPGGVLGGVAAAREQPAAPIALRSEFAETAFWQPHLLTDANGEASIEFTVPDSVTSWNVFVHAITKDWRAGSIRKETRSVKDLMVRPYVPRFLREGDRAELKIVVNNASEKEMSGKVSIDILDTETNASVLGEFGVSSGTATQPFRVSAGGGANVSVPLTAPRRLGLYAFKVTAVSGDTSDGELRPVPLLTSRFELAQSRFVTLHDADRREMTFADLAKNDDPTRVNEQLVVTVDAQLFYSALSALPYLVNYPYECTEQTLNRFVSTGIVSSLFRDYPAVAKMAQELAKRDTRLETWDSVDANRRMTLEETPWLETAKGGRDTGNGLARVLDPRIAKAERDTAMAKLRKAQTESGGFPWWPGGPPSTYMTTYILHGFANLLEFGGEVPKDMVLKAWQYAGRDIRRDLDLCMHLGHYCPFVTFVNYTLSSYPDESWYKPAFDEAYRKILLDYSFAHWKEHSPYLKGELALTLKRMGRAADAKLVWDSVMDSAKTDRDLGTYWAPEDRSWLWYNDTIETQAFALRTLDELEPADSRRAGLVQWLMLNKKLNQWKSTRATAEVIYSLAHYLRKEGALGVREDATVTAAGQKTTFVFEPDRYTGKKNQVVISGEKIDPKTAATVVVEKQGKGLAFASATWHFSTEQLPAEDRGDFFTVSRRYFKRESTAQGFVLRPIGEGATVSPGDEVEVQILLRAKHAAEYVHLRDPRAAGLEPENVLSRYKWDLGISWYEETRDSGSNFFFEQLPAGEYTFKYRVRANMAGTFRVGPATVESMYAPEFVAYSAGDVVTVK